MSQQKRSSAGKHVDKSTPPNKAKEILFFSEDDANVQTNN